MIAFRPTTDAVHLALMVAAMSMAYLLPFELLLLSYTVLGPLHYLTEISWLHDRRYFLPTKSIGLILVGFCTPAFFLFSTYWFGLVLWAAFLIGALAVARVSFLQRAVLIAFAAALSAVLLTQSTFPFVAAILLPSLVHVSVFTMVFMAIGAHRAGSKTQWLLLAFYPVIIALILIVPPDRLAIVPHSLYIDQYYFGNIGTALGILLRLPKLPIDGRIAGLLSFVYTYHYLNWFIKADTIGWRRIHKGRLATIAALSLSATGLYFYDFGLGITVLMSLSLAHVVLEFPLNAISLHQLAVIATRAIVRPVQNMPTASKATSYAPRARRRKA